MAACGLAGGLVGGFGSVDILTPSQLAIQTILNTGDDVSSLYVMLVLGVDVGIVNLAFVLIEVNESFHVTSLRDWRHIDITILRHNRVARCNCTLGHGNTLTDRLAHVFQEEAGMLACADVVVIEQQPPGGHQGVEQLIYSQFRYKAQLVSPRSMHCYYCIQDKDYDGRKAHLALLFSRLSHVDECVKNQLRMMERSHDVIDAYFIAAFYVQQQKSKLQTTPRVYQEEDQRLGFESFLAQFRYTRRHGRHVHAADRVLT